MSTPADGSPVPGHHELLRLPTPPKDFVPGGWTPTYLEFQPSSEDRRDAEKRGTAIRVSVWDETLTTAEQVLAFRATPTLVLQGRVGAVLECDGGVRAIVYDRLDDIEKPGALGHVGMEGLDRPPNQPRTEWRERLQRIADCFRLLSFPDQR